MCMALWYPRPRGEHAMPANRDDAIKELLLADIERDRGRERKLRAELMELQVSIRRDTAYFERRFGRSLSRREPTTAPPKGTGPRLRRRASGPSHAQLAAVALTRADKVSAPLKIAQIHRYLDRAGLGSMTHPTRQTLISSIMRSPLYQKVGRGLYALVRAIGREDLAMTSGTGAAGAQAGNEETIPAATGETQGSEAAPATPSDL